MSKKRIEHLDKNTKYPVLVKATEAYGLPWKEREILLCLGEITNMPGHVVLVNKQNSILWGYHADNFVVANEDET